MGARTAWDSLWKQERILVQALLSCHPFSWGDPHHFSKLALRLGLFSWLGVGWDYSQSPAAL